MGDQKYQEKLLTQVPAMIQKSYGYLATTFQWLQETQTKKKKIYIILLAMYFHMQYLVYRH